MPEAIMKALATITEPDTDDAPYGGFTAVLSTPSLDRDGDELSRDEWIEPLPKSISIDIDHTMSVEGTVGSGRPYFDDNGRLMLDARFANTEKAQTVRSLVKDGHVGAVSVAFLNRRTEKGAKPQRELLNAGIVAVPANPDAVILSSKALDAVEAYQKAAKKDDGPYADPGYLDSEGKPAKDGNGQPRYKIDSEETTRAAWSYINMPKNARFYTAEQLAKIKDKIKAAAEKFGIEIAEDDDKKSIHERAEIQPLAVDSKEFGYATSVADLLAAAVTLKAGARNSASDSKMIQAIHDASALLGAQCVSEASPDEEDGAAEGANKAVRQSFVVGKALTGSIEDLGCRLQEALCDATGAGTYSGAYPYVRATYLNPDGNGGSVVYDLGGETLCRAFSDDGTCVALDSNIQVVTVITTVTAVPDTVDGDPTPLPPAAAEAAKSVDAASLSVRDIEDFKAKLDALTKTSGLEPGSPDSPAEDASASPDSKAASKDPADDESADTDDDDSAADEDTEDDDEDEKVKFLRARLLMAKAETALAS